MYITVSTAEIISHQLLTYLTSTVYTSSNRFLVARSRLLLILLFRPVIVQLKRCLQKLAKRHGLIEPALL
jgi:hypothetical protein